MQLSTLILVAIVSNLAVVVVPPFREPVPCVKPLTPEARGVQI